MLDALSEKFENIFKKLRGSGVLTEQNIAEALKEVRLALLEADVNFKIVKDFIERVREKAVGQEVLRSLTPGHQVVKVVWEELREMMGRERAGLALVSNPPTVRMGPRAHRSKAIAMMPIDIRPSVRSRPALRP